METATAGTPSGWHVEHLGPWERYRRTLRGGRVVTVARGMGASWIWDMWGAEEEDQCLDLASGEFDTPELAMLDAEQAIEEYAAVTDERLAAKNGIDAYRETAVLKLVAVGEGRKCSLCQSEIAPGAAAENKEGWLLCGSCATRNPDSVIAATTDNPAAFG
jgi:hypothetical protein